MQCRAVVDATLSHTQRTVLRRIAQGEPVGDLGDALGKLYLEGLVDDLAGDGHAPEPRITADGLRVLKAHDTQVASLPQGWRIDDGDVIVHRDVEHPRLLLLLRAMSDEELTRQIRSDRATLLLHEWEQERRTLARLIELRERHQIGEEGGAS